MISVVVVTYNRALLLDALLQSIFNNSDSVSYEVIVVNDHSTDNTLDVLHHYKERFLGKFEYISNESIKGLSYSKNQGIAKAKGSIIAFTDDDCEVPMDWLQKIEKLFLSNSYNAVFGPVKIKNKNILPWYWRDSMNWMIGVSEQNKYPIGSNLIIRSNIFTHYSFNTVIGPNNGKMSYGEDLELVLRLKRNISLQYIPGIIVFHNVVRKKVRFLALLKRAFKEGFVCAEIKKERFGKRLIVFMVGPVKSLLTFDLNFVFRSVVSLGYMWYGVINNKRY